MTVKQFNNIIINGSSAYIEIINRLGNIFHVKIDVDDIIRLKEYGKPWHVAKSPRGSYYVYCCLCIGENNKGKRIYREYALHSFILGIEFGSNIHVDHINHDKLDNRKINLRPTNNSKNNQNREKRNINNKTGYRNVCLCEGKYRVQLQVEGKSTVLGSFDTIEESSIFAEKMREKYYGEYKGGN
jgi:hypothetical protein